MSQDGKHKLIISIKEFDENYFSHKPGRNYLQEMPLDILYEAGNSTRFSYGSPTSQTIGNLIPLDRS